MPGTRIGSGHEAPAEGRTDRSISQLPRKLGFQRYWSSGSSRFCSTPTSTSRCSVSSSIAPCESRRLDRRHCRCIWPRRNECGRHDQSLPALRGLRRPCAGVRIDRSGVQGRRLLRVEYGSSLLGRRICVVAVASGKRTMPEKPQPRRDESCTPRPLPPGSYVPPKSPDGLVVTFRKGERVREADLLAK